MKYNSDNIEKIAWRLVEDMSLKDLEIFVYDNLVGLMQKNEDVFHLNVEYTYGE